MFLNTFFKIKHLKTLEIQFLCTANDCASVEANH